MKRERPPESFSVQDQLEHLILLTHFAGVNVVENSPPFPFNLMNGNSAKEMGNLL